MENENSYLNKNEGTSKNMFENHTNFDAVFLQVLNKLAVDILGESMNIKDDFKVEEREIPDSRGQVLTLVSFDGVNETKAFVDRMKGNRLSTGPFELHGKMFCIFH
jgi:hypothetical protein